MSDNDFAEAINQEVDSKYQVPDDASSGHLRSLLGSALEDLKMSKIEM